MDINSFKTVMADPATAAWVQALGSLGALGIAIWLAHRAEANHEKRAEKDALMQQRRADRQAILFADGLIKCLENLASISAFPGHPLALIRRHELSDLIDLGQSIRLDLLNEGNLEPFVALRAIAAATSPLSVQISGNKFAPGMRAEQYDPTFRDYLEKAKKQRALFVDVR